MISFTSSAATTSDTLRLNPRYYPTCPAEDEIVIFRYDDLQEDRHMPLKDFIQDSNTHAREAIFNYRLLYDLAVAGAEREYWLAVFQPAVDHDGYDIVLDDADATRYIQNKTLLPNASTRSWKIHRKLLRPSFNYTCYNCTMQRAFGFENDACGEGMEGGVIIKQIGFVDNEMAVSYYYTDLYIITAFRVGIIKRHNEGTRTQRKAGDIVHKLGEHPTGTVSIPRSMFLSAKSPGHLLGMMGLHNSKVLDSLSWRNNIIRLSLHSLSSQGAELFDSDGQRDSFSCSVYETLGELSSDSLEQGTLDVASA
jgi:hypothetical protein